MMLYHGSPVAGILRLVPHDAEHGRAVFLTDNPTLAAIYAHKNHVWYTYCFDREHRLIYDEVFPDQLQRLYQGQPGYVYTVDTTAPRHERMPWVYLSGEVDTADCLFIPDLYDHLLEEIAAGRLILRRHEEMPERLLASYRRMTVDHLIQTGSVRDPACEYAQFVQTYLPDCWQEAVQQAAEV